MNPDDVHFDMRRGRIVNHLRFSDLPAIRHGNRPLAQAQPLHKPVVLQFGRRRAQEMLGAAWQ